MMEQRHNNKSNSVLVVGGGIGGIKTGLDLAEAGRNVVIIDKEPTIGGLMTQLDRTFPTNNCDLCTLSPHLSESGRNLRVELMSLTRLTGIEGEAGRFRVSLRTEPRYIDLEKCTACGDCLKRFPECVRFTPGLDSRAPTCMRYPQATPGAYSVDMDRCSSVEELIRTCEAGAIIPDDRPRISELEVGAVVLAPGAEVFDPRSLVTYGNGAYPNVVSSLEYERILSASGPSSGQLVRPSDETQPKRIAWIQCVGSRSARENHVPYCSSACCMYALKEAMVTKERFRDDIETVIFYMDMRTSGKDYEQYYQRARDQYGVNLVRCRPHSVEPVAHTDDLAITYMTEDSDIPKTEIFDMVVLTVGFRVSRETVELAQKLGIEINEHGFARTGSFDPVATSKPGVYVAGLFESPKDIPETMVQASAAACKAFGCLSPEEAKSLGSDEELPPERDVSGEDPKIGVFVCACGRNIGGVIDVNEVASYASRLPSVVVSEVVGHGCSLESLARIDSLIKAQGLNRIVIGGCSPRTHLGLFQDMARQAGLNKYLVDMANIRDQDTWVHGKEPDKATEKAKDLIRMSVVSSALLHPLTEHTLPVNKDALVVGGGVTGMNAALSLADQGVKVYLVDRAPELGGVATHVRKTLEGEDVQAYLAELADKVRNHPQIQVMTRSVIVDHSGMPGMFKTGLQVGPRMNYREINHGVAILATGALPNRPQEYLLGSHGAVMTQLDMESVLEDEPERVKSWNQIVMIQCVGSRIPENPSCSRICCQAAVKNALRILEIHPDAQVCVLYRDMRTYGFQEEYYRKAREKGVMFSRYTLDRKPRVSEKDSRLEVELYDPVLAKELRIPADCLVLSTGFVADEEGTEDLATIFHLNRNDAGYFLEDHVKLRPVDLSVPGFLVAGTSHSPKGIRECIAQAQAAAGRALTYLARETITLGASVARVDRDKCAACLICVRACPFGVPFINAEGYSEIDPSLCHGCGVCAAECPAKAIQLMEFEDAQLTARVDGLLERIVS